MISNFSRSFVQSFPAQNLSWFYNGAVPAAYITNNVNLLGPNSNLSTATGSGQVYYYTDATRRNYRTIYFTKSILDIPDTFVTITGKTQTGIATETLTILGTFLGPAISTNKYLYLTSITVNTSAGAVALNSVILGNGYGNSQWIMHDGSPFNNFVNISGTVNWTIYGTLQKWNGSTSPAGGGNTGAIIYNPLQMPIQANLTSQAASTANPILVTAPYNGLQLVVDSTTTGQVDWYFANQQLL